MSTPASLPTARILLIGMMGAGKSAVGLSLARRTGWRYVDNDELLLVVTGHTARELWMTGGDASLRASEAAVLEQALRLPPPVIVAIPAGVVLDPGTRRRLREAGHVVWLRASAATLLPRLRPGDHRPFMEGDLKGWLRRTVAQREPLYGDAAHAIVDVDDRTPDQVADDIMAALRAAGARSAVGAGGTAGIDPIDRIAPAPAGAPAANGDG